MSATGAGPAGTDVGEEVVALVVHQDVGREVLDGNLPDGFHTQLGVLDALDGGDAVLGQIGRHTADGAEVETTVFLAGIRHALGAVALGNHNHAAAMALEEVYIGIHTPGCGGTEGAGGIALGGLGGAGVVDGVILHILRQVLTGVQQLLELGVGDIATHDDGTAEGEAGLATGETSAKLYYNLANACFKQEELGRAILFYRRALRLQPGDADIRYNLSVAEARTKDTIERIPEFFLVTWLRALRHTMSATAWTVWSIVWLLVALSLVLFYLLAQRLSLRKVGFYGTLAALLLFVVTTWFAAASRTEQIGEEEAVVISLSAAVKASPDRASTDLFVLHEGTVVEVTNRLGDWCEVMIADGKKGWTEQSRIEVI